ncbi:hypothetical protein [Pseudoalteromonas porphyrae]|uniref:Uncharacterized protein n=1 Tax=Pseudoalteromonas porphyrae TaxID=187330 RepID=A0A0N1EMF3_9GAMM|nr:hypothetical protein [Pseudoalteromonas porphyrae]KPH56823.1 hypothetical protein ADS77_20010 [Pseudoalteromonas porphyrae]
MRLSLIAVLLPLCLSACSDAGTSGSNTTNSVAENSDTSEHAQLSPAPAALIKDNQTTKVDPLTNVVASKESLSIAHQQLKDLISDPQCDDHTQCKILAIGSRACGGPSSYVAYSTKSADEQEVLASAKQITSLESQFNAQTGMISICQHLTEPSAQCIENKCVKLEGSAASVY